MSINQMSQIPSIHMEKESQLSLSSERLEFLLQQALQNASGPYTNTNPAPASTHSPSLSIQDSFSSASPASSRDYLSTPEQALEDEVFDFAFDQPLFPPQPQSGAGINSTAQVDDIQDWLPLFNTDGNGMQIDSMGQSNDAPRVSPQPQLTTVDPASVEDLDLGMTIKHFLDASPDSTLSPITSVHSLQSSCNANENEDENLDDLAKNFLRKFAHARKSEDVSFLINAFRGAGIEIPSEIMDHQKSVESGGQGKSHLHSALHDHLQCNSGDTFHSSQLPSFGSNRDARSSGSTSSSSSSYGASPFSDWNVYDYALINQSSDSVTSNSVSNTSSLSPGHDSSKTRSSSHSTLNKDGVRKPRSAAKKRGSEGNPKCPECGKEFSRMFNMKTHLETHLSPDARPKPFVCNVDPEKCTRGFSRRSDLKRHIRTVHPDINKSNDKKDLDTMVKDGCLNSASV